MSDPVKADDTPATLRTQSALLTRLAASASVWSAAVLTLSYFFAQGFYSEIDPTAPQLLSPIDMIATARDAVALAAATYVAFLLFGAFWLYAMPTVLVARWLTSVGSMIWREIILTQGPAGASLRDRLGPVVAVSIAGTTIFWFGFIGASAIFGFEAASIPGWIFFIPFALTFIAFSLLPILMISMLSSRLYRQLLSGAFVVTALCTGAWIVGGLAADDRMDYTGDFDGVTFKDGPPSDRRDLVILSRVALGFFFQVPCSRQVFFVASDQVARIEFDRGRRRGCPALSHAAPSR